MKKIKVASVFSGIGAFEYALKKLSVNHEVLFACDNGERELEVTDLDQIHLNKLKTTVEKNNFFVSKYSTLGNNLMRLIYEHNYGTSNLFIEDIRAINGKEFIGKIDILVGGSPCQSFSNMGKIMGLDDPRGQLLDKYFDLVITAKPKAFIFENVPGLKSVNKGKFVQELIDKIEKNGYYCKILELSAKDYGIPQFRKRFFIVGMKQPFELKIQEEHLKNTVSNYLDNNIDDKYYLPKKGFEFVTKLKYKNRAEIDPMVQRTQRANQQFNWNGTFHFVPINKIKVSNKEPKVYISEYKGQVGGIRKLTPRECFRLMGFEDDFLIPNNINDKYLYRMSGNAMVVNVIKEIVRNVIKELK
jgi:DNA (cytosine-5)-methyltransferase 1